MYMRRGLLVDRYPVWGTFYTNVVWFVMLILSSGLQLLVLALRLVHFPNLVILDPIALTLWLWLLVSNFDLWFINYLTDITGPPASIPMYKRPASRKPVLDWLTRLNSSARPALSEIKFRGLFAKCHCGLIMTQQVFRVHTCAPAAPVIIDLTSDDSDLAANSASAPTIIDLTSDSDNDVRW